MIEYFRRIFLCMCVQTLLIWSCDHGRIPHQLVQLLGSFDHSVEELVQVFTPCHFISRLAPLSLRPRKSCFKFKPNMLDMANLGDISFHGSLKRFTPDSTSYYILLTSISEVLFKHSKLGNYFLKKFNSSISNVLNSQLFFLNNYLRPLKNVSGTLVNISITLLLCFLTLSPQPPNKNQTFNIISNPQRDWCLARVKGH